MDIARYVGKRYLRCGYTTGSCAAAAAKAAVTALLSGSEVRSVTISVPKGFDLTLDVAELGFDTDSVKCAVRKDSGDDPDITNGVLVYAEVRLRDSRISIEGGVGVGRVTKPGLSVAVGEAAISPVPRAMIEREVTAVCAEFGYSGGVDVVISIPAGFELAKKTFNPNIGIIGGLSVLGTSGIVEPMSSAAMIDSLKLELDILKAAGHSAVMLVIGNYGDAFVKNTLKSKPEAVVKCSNFLGDALDSAVVCGFKKILVVGHIGKLVKLGIGVTNTHSSNGDGRMETLVSCALAAGAELETLRALAGCVTTDAALEVLQNADKLETTMAELGGRIDFTLKRRVPDDFKTGFICFSGDKILTKSENAEELQWCIL